jgi:hypothetical protein
VTDTEDMGTFCLSDVHVLRNTDKNSIMQSVQEHRDEHEHGIGIESNKEEDYGDCE